MSFASNYLFPRIKAPNPCNSRRFHRLSIKASGAGVFMSPFFNPQGNSQTPPQPAQSPLPKIIIYRSPFRIFFRYITPLKAGFCNIQNRIDEGTKLIFAWSACLIRRWKEIFEKIPLTYIARNTRITPLISLCELWG